MDCCRRSKAWDFGRRGSLTLRAAIYGYVSNRDTVPVLFWWVGAGWPFSSAPQSRVRRPTGHAPRPPMRGPCSPRLRKVRLSMAVWTGVPPPVCPDSGAVYRSYRLASRSLHVCRSNFHGLCSAFPELSGELSTCLSPCLFIWIFIQNCLIRIPSCRFLLQDCLKKVLDFRTSLVLVIAGLRSLNNR